MLTVSRCYVCFLDDIEGAMDLLEMKSTQKKEIMQECLHVIHTAIAQGHETEIPSWFITRVHRILKHKLGNSLLFRELRDLCNTIGIEIADMIKAESSDISHAEALKKYMVYAMAGNDLDFRTVGTGYGIGAAEVRKAVEQRVEQGLTIDERDQVAELISQANDVLYIPDNVGEIAFDKLLVDEIIKGGASVTVPYRGGAITSDAVLEDFETVNMGEHAELILAGPDTLGISMDEMSAELELAFQQADLVITKGQANFYFMLAYMQEIAPQNIASILTTKCRHISQILGHDQDQINVVTVIKRGGKTKLEYTE